MLTETSPWAFYLWWEFLIKFCPAIAEIMQLLDTQKSMYGKPKFRETQQAYPRNPRHSEATFLSHIMQNMDFSNFSSRMNTYVSVSPLVSKNCRPSLPCNNSAMYSSVIRWNHQVRGIPVPTLLCVCMFHILLWLNKIWLWFHTRRKDPCRSQICCQKGIWEPPPRRRDR